MSNVIRRGKGHPRHFESSQAFYEAVVEYLHLCEYDWKVFPNVAGFCAWQKMSRETYYKTRDYYTDTFKICEAMFENASIISKHTSDAMKIFYLKNKHGYRDRFYQEVEHTNPLQIQHDLSRLSMDELKALRDLTEKVKPHDDTEL